MNDDLPPLPEPAFRLLWKHGEYRVTKPNIGDTDVYTAAQVEEIRRAAVLAERLATLEAVNALIKDGPFKGNGYDDLAQNNGVILAANLLASRVYAIQKGTP